jgi:hypothetical protein
MTGFHLPGGYVQSRKQGGGAMALVFVTKPLKGLTIGKPQVSLSTLQSLNRRLLIHTQHHGLIRRGEINPYQIGGLGRKLRVGRDALAVPAPQTNAVTSQDSPHLAGRHPFQSLGDQTAAPTGVTVRGRLIEQAQDASFHLRPVAPAGSGPGPILQTDQSLRRETSTPLAHRGRAHPKLLGNRGGRGSRRRGQNQLRSQNQTLLGGRRPHPAFQSSSLSALKSMGVAGRMPPVYIMTVYYVTKY